MVTLCFCSGGSLACRKAGKESDSGNKDGEIAGSEQNETDGLSKGSVLIH